MTKTPIGLHETIRFESFQCVTETADRAVIDLLDRCRTAETVNATKGKFPSAHINLQVL